MPPRFPCQITTQTPSKIYPLHNHGAWIDKDGNGNTDVDAGHFHRVRNFKLIADQSDGHTHQLTTLPCGAGAPITVPRDGQMMGVFGDAASDEAALQHLREIQNQQNYAATKKWTMWLAAGVGLALAVGVTALIVHAARSE